MWPEVEAEVTVAEKNQGARCASSGTTSFQGRAEMYLRSLERRMASASAGVLVGCLSFGVSGDDIVGLVVPWATSPVGDIKTAVGATLPGNSRWVVVAVSNS